MNLYSSTLLLLIAACTPYRTDRYSIAVHEGHFEFQEEIDFQETVIEYRPPHQDGLALRPVVGLSYAADSGHYALAPYLSARYDIAAGNGWAIGPSFGLAYYYREDDYLPDLGSELLFRSAIDITKQITDKLAIGIGWLHLSNGNLLGDSNPGADSFVVTVEWKL